MNKLVNSWGCVHRSRFITPTSQEAFERERMTGATMRCVGIEDGYLVLRYRDETFLASPEGYWQRPAPDYTWDQPVFVPSKGVRATIKSICWHYKDERYFYHVIGEDGKKLKKRYYAEDLEAINER
ncbi:MAG: hypothetical protein Q4B45_01335 [Coriobacteriia bacterium]|nr:hypothetical protein [Coriobacteriia bacterium]